MSKVKQSKCEHNNVYHVQQVDGNSSTHIFECHDCNEYIFVDEIDSPYDWDNACVVSEYDYETYDLNTLKKEEE